MELAFALYLVHPLSGVGKAVTVIRFAAVLLFACSAISFAQAPQIKSGATVYIEPMHGYETYLAAAIAKKHVPLIVVADRDKADYIITSTVSQSAPAQPAVVINNSVNNVNNGSGNTQNARSHGGYPSPGRYGDTSASISVIDRQSSQVVFASAATRIGEQLQRTAEECSKHLKDFIEKSEKPKK